MEKNKTKAAEKAEKAENLIQEIENLIEGKLGDKTFSKNYPFIKTSEPKPDSISIHSLPVSLKNFGKYEEKNWIFYGPPGTGKTFALDKIKTSTIEIVINDNPDYGLLQFYEKFSKLEWEGDNREGNIKAFVKIIHAFLAFSFLNFGIKLLIKKHSIPGVHNGHPLLFIDKTDKDYQFLVNINKNFDKAVHYSIYDNDLLSRPQRKKRELGPIEINSIFKNYDFLKIQLIKVAGKICDSICDSICDLSPEVTKIVFHPSYTYEDFVGGIKPDLVQTKSNDQLPPPPPPHPPSDPSSPNSLTYKYTLGVMLDLIRKAWVSEVVRHYLIIDEFNRGNIAAIFGEFLYLIENDKRSEKENSGNDYVFLPGGIYPWNDKEKVEPFSDECKIRMPENIFIVGALNTADRSIATMDFAMRRRFNFVKFEPNEKLITGFKWGDTDVTGNVQRLFISLNRSIKYKLDADHEIGHYYFMHADGVKDDTEAFLKDLFERKIIPLLEAYCDHDEQAVKMILVLTNILMIARVNDVTLALISLDNLKKLSAKKIKSDYWNGLKDDEKNTLDLYGDLIKLVNSNSGTVSAKDETEDGNK